jgi:signal transduction histidine kinase
MMFVLMPCVLLVAGVGGVLLTDRALGPVRFIVHTAEQLNPDDLSQRLPVVGKDEFAQLASTMNGMLARIEIAFTKLRLTLERERRFTADASHELRTPLTAITANASLTLNGDTSLDEYRESMQSINLAANMMRRLIEDLLLLARSDSGQLQLNYEQVNIFDLMTWAIDMVRKNDAQAIIQIQLVADGESLWGDPTHLLRVLVNLLKNAIRHTPAAGKITLAAAHQDKQVVLSVTDTGDGIAPEHLAHLGERFYRPDSSRAREYGGTGLGLAICKGIVEAHQGSMHIDSTPGKGTTVSITLPDSNI